MEYSFQSKRWAKRSRRSARLSVLLWALGAACVLAGLFLLRSGRYGRAAVLILLGCTLAFNGATRRKLKGGYQPVRARLNFGPTDLLLQYEEEQPLRIPYRDIQSLEYSVPLVCFHISYSGGPDIYLYIEKRLEKELLHSFESYAGRIAQRMD